MQRERNKEKPHKYVFLWALQDAVGTGRPEAQTVRIDDVLELSSSDVGFGRGMGNGNILLFCSFCFSCDPDHALNGVEEEEGDEYKADFETISNLADNIRLGGAGAV